MVKLPDFLRSPSPNENITLDKGLVSPQLALQFAQGAINKQLELIATIDSKLSTVIGFSTGSITVFGGLLVLSRRGVPLTGVILLLLAGIAYVVLMLVLLFALRPRMWLFAPDLHPPVVFPRRSQDALEREMVWATNEFDKMFRSNLEIQESKAQLLRVALILLMIEASLLVASSAAFLLDADVEAGTTSAQTVPSLQEPDVGQSPEPTAALVPSSELPAGVPTLSPE